MAEHKVGTREEWLAARRELLERETELTRRTDELTQQRRELPWVRIDKEFSSATEEGTKTLTELFDGRSQLLVYHLMFGPDWTAACPGCSMLADHFDGALVHLNAHDVTLACVSHAPIEKLKAYKRRMQFAGDESMVEAAASCGTDLEDYVTTEGPGLSAFALEDGVVYHTYSAYAPGSNFLVFYGQLLDRAPKESQQDVPVRRNDEYDGARS